MKINFKKGFTLLELLVVVAIIGLLSTVVMVALNSARNKGGDAGVQSNLRNAIAQGEIFYGTNTASPNTYSSFCQVGPTVGSANTIGPQMTAAIKDAGLASYGINNSPASSGITATCNDSASAWAAEVPLAGSTIVSPQMWCVDSVGKSKQETVSIGAATTCN